MLESLVKAILGQYPEPVSRREYVHLRCDNATLRSALEQKERARVDAVATCRELRRALSEAQRTIEAQANEIACLETGAYRVCYIDGQGIGYFDPSGWMDMPLMVRARVLTLALCKSEGAAQTVARALDCGWRDSITYYNPLANKVWWE